MRANFVFIVENYLGFKEEIEVFCNNLKEANGLLEKELEYPCKSITFLGIRYGVL